MSSSRALLRALLRLAALCGLTGALFTVWVAGLLPARLWARGRERWRDLYFGSWARAVVALLGVEIEVSGRPPRAPFLLVSNHLGYFDVVVLAALVDAVFVAKAEVSRWPLLGFLCSSVDTIFIDRAARRDLPRVLEEIDARLHAGRGVILFPEGTSTAGAEVAPFGASLLAGAADAGQPVHWAALGYVTPPQSAPAHRAVCWWGEMRFPGHLFELLSLPGFRARVVFGDSPVRETDRKRLARTLRAAVRSGFAPVVDLEEICA